MIGKAVGLLPYLDRFQNVKEWLFIGRAGSGMTQAECRRMSTCYTVLIGINQTRHLNHF